MEGIESVICTQDLFAESSAWWEKVCCGVDMVIHSAWYAEPGQYLQSDKNLDCLIGTINLAKGAAKASVKRFIGVGTCFEYKMSPNKPLSIHDPLSPSNPYAGAKAATFLALSQYFLKRNLSFMWCRLFYLYGEGEDSRRFIPYLHNQLSTGRSALLTDGCQIRDFLNVNAAARMIIDATFSDLVGPINICSGIPISLREIAEKIADKYDARDLLSFGSRPQNVFDPPYVVGLCEPIHNVK
jgi:dTDP-6-deoxy-L-talose 4-dehydrogenase (NAD+)